MAPLVRLSIAACVTLLAALAACSGGDEDDASGLGTTTTGAEAGTAAQAPDASSPTTTTTAEKELDSASRVRLDGIGPITMGMTLDEATAAVGRRVAVDPSSLINDDDTDLCGFAFVDGGPEGLGFMVNRDSPGDDWLIARLDVGGGSAVATGAGIRVGASEDDVRRAYGTRLRTEPHHYTAADGGHYMILDVDGTGGMRLLFETDGKRVLSYRAGFDGAVDAVEGCL